MPRRRKLLITQTEPQNIAKSPYTRLAEKHKLQIDFQSFISLKEVQAKAFRKQKVNIPSHEVILFTSRNSIIHFFRLCEDLRLRISESMKYFCLSETIAVYLQKYIVYRKRKIFVGEKTISDLLPAFEKHKDSKILIPGSNIMNPKMNKFLTHNEVNFTKAVVYKTVNENVKHLDIDSYFLMAFFTPLSIKTLFKSFPDYKQNKTLIGCYGLNTSTMAEEKKLEVNIKTPTKKAPSMTMAIDHYLKKRK